MIRFEQLLTSLNRNAVEYIVIGGVAATVHGSARLTNDLDIVYRRSSDNIKHLVDTLQPLNPYLRGAPPGLPFRFDEETIRRGLNFTLKTSLGDIDLLGEVAGGGSYDDLLNFTLSVEAFGVQCRCVNLEKLIATKRAAGRPKDFEVIAELESLRDELR